MIVQIVRFRSELSDAEVVETYEERAPRYRALGGLVQKYYLRFTETGEHGAVYVWDSPESLATFGRSELRATIPDAYRVVGEPHVATAEVVSLLRS